MNKNRVVIIDSDEKQGVTLRALLQGHGYESIRTGSLNEMDEHLADLESGTLIFNLDSIPVTNKMFKELKRKKPDINIMALSKRQFHPELEEALREYISVCLGKPADPDELIYWLNCLSKNNLNLKDRPKAD